MTASWGAPSVASARPAPRLMAGPAAGPMLGSISPAPSDEEIVAIMAATEALWPRPAVLAAGEPATDRGLEWRFSGRWWSRPATARRDRPWLR